MLSQEEISIVEISKQLFISERHLRRKLKKITGLSPSKMIRAIQMKKARNYLESGEYKTISEIAFAVGFQTPSAFSRVYKQHYGKAPKAFFQRK